MANMFNGWGRSGGGCVQEGPFTVPNFHVNIGEANGSSCLRRDFMPGKPAMCTTHRNEGFPLTIHPAILHNDANPIEVQKVLDQPDFASFDRQMEGEPDWFPPAIHAGGHFGIGGMLGQAGNAANSPGGESINPIPLALPIHYADLTTLEPLFYMHHAMIDYVFWKWQQLDPEVRHHQVGGPVKPYDYTGTNVTLDFEINLGAIAPSIPLRDTLDTQGGLFCYTYE